VAQAAFMADNHGVIKKEGNCVHCPLREWYTH